MPVCLKNLPTNYEVIKFKGQSDIVRYVFLLGKCGLKILLQLFVPISPTVSDLYNGMSPAGRIFL